MSFPFLMEGIFGVEGRKAQAFMQGFMQVPVGIEVCMIPHVCARTGEWLCALCLPQNDMCSGHIRGYFRIPKDSFNLCLPANKANAEKRRGTGRHLQIALC